MTRKTYDILDLMKWVINILILVIGFFIASKLNAVDKMDSEVKSIQYWQAGDIERDIQAMQKLDKIIQNQEDASKQRAILDQRIDDLLILNPNLKTTKRP